MLRFYEGVVFLIQLGEGVPFLKKSIVLMCATASGRS